MTPSLPRRSTAGTCYQHIDDPSDLPLQLLDDPGEIVEFVPVERPATATDETLLPQEHRGKLALLAIHDGDVIPTEYLRDRHGDGIPLHRYAGHYCVERDWGSGELAAAVAAHLGLGGYHRVRIARVLMDFGRFPGQTPPEADHLHRYALNYPFSHLLDYRARRRVLEDLYDRCSNAIDDAVRGKLTTIAVHTYDPLNASGTQRPDASLITRPVAYQEDSRLPTGVFDPSYPDVLAEVTADRMLRDRISLTLEKGRVRVAHNYPYLLPEGSVEVRSQVWFFFNWLRGRFTAVRPETLTSRAFKLVWHMLCDTNLRSGEAEALRSYLHLFRTPDPTRGELLAEAVGAYEQVDRFITPSCSPSTGWAPTAPRRSPWRSARIWSTTSTTTGTPRGRG